MDNTEQKRLATCACNSEFGHFMHNVGHDHFATCDTCGVYWHVGQTLLSGWKYELEQLGPEAANKLWRENEAMLLMSYRPRATQGQGRTR